MFDCGGILSVMINMKAIEQYFPVVLFVMIYKVILMFALWDEILNGVNIHWLSEQPVAVAPLVCLHFANKWRLFSISQWLL